MMPESTGLPTRTWRSVAFGLLCLCPSGLLLAVSPACAQDRTPLIVYTALEPEQQGPFKTAIEAAVPEVEIRWVYMQTGALTERVMAEREHPRADMILALAATSMIAFKQAGLLLPYRPAGADQLRPQFIDATAPHSWTGMDAYLGVVCFNDAAGPSGVSAPVTWRDLLAPAYKGRIAMPDPNATGTGYLLVAGWLQSMGEREGWAFMDALHENVSAYLQTGAAPCNAVAEGTYAAGLTYDMRAALLKSQGAPIRILVPLDGVGWEVEAFAIMATTPHADLGKRVANWAASEAANRLYGETFAIVAHPNVGNAPPTYPAYAENRMIRNDLGWMSNNRTRILAEWTRRYGAKSVPPRGANP